MSAVVERIVVQTTAQDKEAIVAKAKKLKLPISELMRRGAFSYQPNDADAQLGALADAALAASLRSCDAIDSALDFVRASEKRIVAMEAKVKPRSPKKAGA